MTRILLIAVSLTLWWVFVAATIYVATYCVLASFDWRYLPPTQGFVDAVVIINAVCGLLSILIGPFILEFPVPLQFPVCMLISAFSITTIILLAVSCIEPAAFKVEYGIDYTFERYAVLYSKAFDRRFANHWNVPTNVTRYVPERGGLV